MIQWICIHYLVKSSSNTWNCSLRIPAVFHMVQLQSPLFSFWNFLAWIRKKGKQIPSIEYSNKLGADLLQSKFATCNWKLVIWTAARPYPLLSIHLSTSHCTNRLIVRYALKTLNAHVLSIRKVTVCGLIQAIML